MGSMSPEPLKPWIETPTIFSAALSHHAGCNIYLKLENLQPSGSFKSRGIGNLMNRAAQAAAPMGQDVHFFCSSGGNAGLACATSAIALCRRATIVVPLSTPQLVIGKLRDLGADVIQIGANWGEADAHLRKLLEEHNASDNGSVGVYVPPFDHPHIWEGAASLVDEMVRQMRDVHGGPPIDAVVCSVGGGGLLCGLMDGFEQLAASKAGSSGHQHKPRILAVETVGADSLNASVRAGEHVTLPAITSIATTLGASRVAARAYEWATARDCKGSAGVTSITVSDAEAVMGVARLLDHARLLTEPACGATMATAYNGALRTHLGRGMSDAEWATQNVILVVCGGSSIDLEVLTAYKKKYGV